MGFGLLLYVPIVFWIVTYWERFLAPSPLFHERNVAWTTIGTGLVAILFAQGPAFFIEDWLHDILAPLFHTFYGLGFGFLVAGAFPSFISSKSL